MRHLFVARSAVVFLTATLAATGCKCNSAQIGQTNGEINVIWRNFEGARITNRDATFDFGLGLSGKRKNLTMTLRNTGSGKLTLSKLERTEGDEVAIGARGAVVPTSTSSFEAEFETLVLQPSEQQEFTLTFTPSGLKGNYFAQLLLSTEGTRFEDSTAVITLLGRGEQGSCELPDVIDFGKTTIGETLSASAKFQNPTSLEGVGATGVIQGGDAAVFGYSAPSAPGDVTVPPMSSTDVVFTFSPTEMRSYEATVVLRGAGECPDKTVILRGQGSTETLTWTPTSIAYGYVNPGSETLREVVFVNPASVPITLTQVNSTNTADFYHAPPTGTDAQVFVVAPNSVPTAMKIACNPSALGPRTGSLTFSTGLRANPTGTISLTCTGGGPRIKVTPRPTLSFGRVGYFPGNTAFSVQRKINVQNVGTRPPMPDPTANLYLGQVLMGQAGQLPLFELAAEAGTADDEFTLALGSAYNPANGLQAIAGQNFVDIVVTLKPQSIGMKKAKLTLFSNDPSEPIIEVNLAADVQQLPPCSFVISPSNANFGLVTPGTVKELPITITNNSVTPGEVCYLSGIELGAGSDLAYSIVGGNIVEKELQPQESFQVVVRVAPTGATPTTLQTLTGQLVFNSTAAAQPQVSVPLRTSVGPSCLTVTPDPMDFGTVRVGCSSASRTFNVYNTCSTNVTLTRFSLQAAGGQPAGGANCSGTNACPEFFITQSPNIPTAGLTLVPGGGAMVTFQARYRPIDVGGDSGAVAIDALQNGQSITYLVGLQGRGDTTGVQVDTYTQDLRPKADILLVADDSCSMQDKQMALAANFNSFIQYAVAANVDYQIGVTSTTETTPTCSPGPFGQSICTHGSIAYGGRLAQDGPTGLKFVKPTTPMVSTVFSRLVNVGTNGAATEAALATAVLALTPPILSSDNAGFLRSDANLAVVVVSDATDQSSQPVSYYQNLLVNVKGFQRLSYFTFSAITPRLRTPPSQCSYDDVNGSNSARYDPVVQYTSGVADEICNSNWSTALQNLGRTAFGFRTQFYLNNAPDQSMGQIVVKVNGVVIPPGPNTWTFDAATNSVKFSPAATPPPGVPLDIQYTQACF
jgi:hypothetical protein